MLRFLIGPLDHPFSEGPMGFGWERAECRTWDLTGRADFTLPMQGEWDQIRTQLPENWVPDLLVVCLFNSLIPEWIWQAPIPIIGWAPAWDQRWHAYRYLFPFCDRVWTDPEGVARFQKAGFQQVRAATSWDPIDSWQILDPAKERDIDLLVFGESPPVELHRRNDWLACLAELGERHRVVIQHEVRAAERRLLLERAKMVWHPLKPNHRNDRAHEITTAGALLFQPESTPAESPYLRAGRDYLPCTPENLEAQVDRYIRDPEERMAIVRIAQAQLSDTKPVSPEDEPILALEAEWSILTGQVQTRVQHGRPRSPMSVVWKALTTGLFDPAFEVDRLDDSDPFLANAWGIVSSDPNQSLGWFRKARSADPFHPIYALNFAEALARVGQKTAAIEEAQRAWNLIHRGKLTPQQGETPLGQSTDPIRLRWEACAWNNPEDRHAELTAKARLVQARLSDRLARWTGELSHFQQAAFLDPDNAAVLGALGEVFRRAKRLAEAAGPLRRAVELDPWDRAAALSYLQVLTDLQDGEERDRFAQLQVRLAKVAPEVVPLEGWFTDLPPLKNERVTIIILCWNQIARTRECLASIFAHTRPPYELILIDNGSTDGTGAYLDTLRFCPGPVRIEIIQNPTNRGFPAGVNQGLAVSNGPFIVLLNNDTHVTPEWLERLVSWSLHDWPKIGMVGPVSNATAPPQRVVAEYQDLTGLVPFAQRRGREFAGRAQQTPRLKGFCLLIRRAVLESIGGLLDERFGLGFFEDDDLSVRVQQAGFQMLVALDVYIHHHGSQSFLAHQIDTDEQLNRNFQLFREKWGEEHSRGYRLTNAVDVPNIRSSVPKANVSLCVIARNEQKNLPDCLGPLRDLVGEIIVLDTGSTDKTRSLAAALGAKVHEMPWPDSFAVARNECLRHASGDWIFWMDADDRVDDENKRKLKALFESLSATANHAYVMKCLCVPSGPGETGTVVDHVRLFRNDPRIRWRYRVHEQILPAIRATGGEVRWSDVTIQHVGYVDAALRARKLERDLRLLHLEVQEQPDDPFTLFNLGSSYHELHRYADALPILRKSLARSRAQDSIVRKLYALIAQCHRHLGQGSEALQACVEGRGHYPLDAELLFVESLIRRENQDRIGAENCLKALIAGEEGNHFASVDTGLRGYKARHNLAVLYLEDGKRLQAESQWQACLIEEPRFLPALQGLGELYLRYRDWMALTEHLDSMRKRGPREQSMADWLAGRAFIERGEFAAARRHLVDAIHRMPTSLDLRLSLSHALLKEGLDHMATEMSLREVLQLAPDHPETKHNLALLLRKMEKTKETM